MKHSSVTGGPGSAAEHASCTPAGVANDVRPWALLEQRTLVETDLLAIREHVYRLPDGSREDGWHVVEERDGTIVVAVTDNGQVVLVEQYRPAVERPSLELPAGFLERGERDPLARAQAELREETGYEAAEWHSLGVVHPAPSRLAKQDHCFLALGARKVQGQDLDPSEFVVVSTAPLDRVEALIADGTITNAVCIAAFARARVRLRTLTADPAFTGTAEPAAG